MLANSVSWRFGVESALSLVACTPTYPPGRLRWCVRAYGRGAEAQRDAKGPMVWPVLFPLNTQRTHTRSALRHARRRPVRTRYPLARLGHLLVLVHVSTAQSPPAFCSLMAAASRFPLSVLDTALFPHSARSPPPSTSCQSAPRSLRPPIRIGVPLSGPECRARIRAKSADPLRLAHTRSLPRPLPLP